MSKAKSYYVVFDYVSSEDRKTGSMVIDSESSLNEKFIESVREEIKDHNNFDDVIILNVIKLEE